MSKPEKIRTSKGQRIKRFMAALNSMILMYVFSAVPSFADGEIEEAAEKGSTGIINTLQGIAPFVLPVVIAIIGLVLAIGGERAKEGVKAETPHKIVGIVLLMMAGGISAAILGWMAN
jgi:hypothetical protein